MKMKKEAMEGMRRHKLMTKELAARFAKVGRQERVKDPIVVAHFFSPYSGWDWYATEYDSELNQIFGLAHGHEAELGYSCLTELAETAWRGVPAVERDCGWTERPLSVCRKGREL